MRLIDANALKEALNYIYDCAYIDSKSKEGIASDIIATIDNAPTVDMNTELSGAYLKGGSNYDKEYAKRIGVDND